MPDVCQRKGRKNCEDHDEGEVDAEVVPLVSPGEREVLEHSQLPDRLQQVRESMA